MQHKIFDMTGSVDRRYFVELAAMDPGEVCHRASCRYDAAAKSYVLRAWGDDYVVCPGAGEVVCRGGGAMPSRELFSLFIVYYLLHCEKTGASGEWISEKDVPGGATFFRGPHEIPSHLISERFGDDVGSFGRVCAHLSGTPLEMGDAAYRFEITSKIPVAVLLWEGDGEFPPAASILYDRTITRHLTPDIIFVLAAEICSRIGAGG